MAQPATRDHRHRHIDSGQHGRQQKRNTIADTTCRMLVDHGLANVPRQDIATIAHRKRQRHAAFFREALQQHRHREGPGLRIGHASGCQATREPVQLRLAWVLAVADGFDDLAGVHQVLSICALTKAPGSRSST